MNEDALVIRRQSWQEEDLSLLCGIANAGGGSLIITSEDLKKRRTYKQLRKSFETIPQLTQSKLGITCSTRPVMDGVQLCLEIVVPAADEPISYGNSYYLYTNKQNKIIEGSELQRLLDKNQIANWELRVQPFVRQEDFDSKTLENMAKLAAENYANERSDKASLTRLFEEYGLRSVSENSFTNIGVLLLHSNPEHYIRGAYIRIGQFDAQGRELGDAQSITGPLTEQLFQTTEQIIDYYSGGSSDPRTSETPCGHDRAARDAFLANEHLLRDGVKETLLNALVHKDYDSAVPIRVSIYPDRFYIDNVGRPPENWTHEDLVGRHNSRPNNPDLALILQKVGLFNGWGSGISRIQRACSEAGLAEPIFRLHSDEMEVLFSVDGDDCVIGDIGNVENADETEGRHSRSSERKGNAFAAHNDAAANPQSLKATQSPKSDNQRTLFKDQSIAAAHRLDMTSTDEYVLKALEINGRVTALRIAEVLGVSESTVRRSFRRLKQLGFIERIGSDKAGYWHVTDIDDFD